MKKDFSNVIKNLKCEIINSIIEEFETYNKNEVDLWLFDVDDEVRENEIINEWMKLTQTFFIGTNCIANKIYKNDKNQYIIYYEVEDNDANKLYEVEIDIANHDNFSVDKYNALYNLLSDDDVKKANMFCGKENILTLSLFWLKVSFSFKKMTIGVTEVF